MLHQWVALHLRPSISVLHIRPLQPGKAGKAVEVERRKASWSWKHTHTHTQVRAMGEAHQATKTELLGAEHHAPCTGGCLDLLKPFQLGPFKLSHRVVMAPLTRNRSYNHVPQSHAIKYYAERATPGGLIITEATVVSETGHGYVAAPGSYTEEHVEAWKPIVKAVHDKGCTFIMQLWHVGRISHSSFQPNGGKPLSSTNRRIKTGDIAAADGSMQPYSEPRALTKEEIPGVINDFVKAAKYAIAAGFDGVEIHGAHGYLLEQFMKSEVNDRTDEYGGSLENRVRFTLELVDAVVAAVGAEKVGIRISPFASSLGEAKDKNPFELGMYLAENLGKRKLLYLHAVQPRIDVFSEQDTEHTLEPFKKAFGGPLLGAGGFKRDTGNEAVHSGEADLIVYGRLYLANPDLVKRFKLNAPLNKYNRETFYIQDPVLGYVDYPFLEESDPEFAKSHS